MSDWTNDWGCFRGAVSPPLPSDSVLVSALVEKKQLEDVEEEDILGRSEEQHLVPNVRPLFRRCVAIMMIQ